MIKLQPGDYVSTEGMTKEQYHAVCKAFMGAGCPIEENENYRLAELYPYFGWGVGDNWSGLYHGGEAFFTRKLPIQQILGEEETKIDIKEAYKVMQANCGIEVGDTVKVLRKAENHEMGWKNSWTLKMDYYVGSTQLVTDVGDSGISLKDTYYKFPFFVLELVKKGKKLPSPFRISSQYEAKFNEDGSIDVGGQHIYFEKLEEVYLTAKRVKES